MKNDAKDALRQNSKRDASTASQGTAVASPRKGCFYWAKRAWCGWTSLGRTTRKVIMVVAVALLLVLAGALVAKCYIDRLNAPKMQESIATIQEIKLKGEIYVCSSVIEDYVIERRKEKRVLLSDKEYSCIQTLTQKCSYKINLSDVAYLANDSIKVVYVHVPEIEYVASTQSASFISDDSQYWAKHKPNTNKMKRDVEDQIRMRFDTPENRRKAEAYAEEAIGGMLSKLGYQTEFFNSLESGSVEGK